MIGRIKRTIRRENGQSLVEFAIVLPILLTLLCGVIDFGWIYSNQYKVKMLPMQGHDMPPCMFPIMMPQT